MASESAVQGHLDAFAGREVVYCHQCEHEWYRDDGGLVCPRCDGEATEIVTAENDPRDMEGGLSFADLHEHHHDEHRHWHDDTDSDPDEADIEEHINPRGFFSRRAVYRDLHEPSQEVRARARPENPDDIIRRFSEMIGDLGGPPMAPDGPGHRSGSESLFGDSGGDGLGGGPGRVRYQRISGPGFSGGISSFTISTGGNARPLHGAGSPPGGNNPDPFQQYDIPSSRGRGTPRLTFVSLSTGTNRNPRAFANIFGAMPMPSMPRDGGNNLNQPDGHGGPPGSPADLPTLLNQLFASVLNPNAVHGDAVYSQEALDRIITNLMEANPQSNAPPPASPETIANLSRKKLDEEMLGPELKGECTICIDEMKLGDEVVVLPCKHWFHDECVVLWLKEHNTCPICRAAIEGSQAGEPGASAQSSSQAQASSASSSRAGAPGGSSERLRENLQQRSEARLQSIRDAAAPYDRRNSSRRTSNSPPSNLFSSQPIRTRSPSPAGRRSTQNEQNRDSGGSSNNPLHWIRDQFSRGDRRRS